MNENHVFGLTAMEEHPARKQPSENQSQMKVLLKKETHDTAAKSKKDLKMPLVNKATQQNFFEATRQRFHKLKDVLQEVKQQEKRGKGGHSQQEHKVKFIKIFSDKIENKYEKLYGLQKQDRILSELKSLEKRTFLQKELNNVEFMMESGKRKCNQIKYQFKQRMQHLERLLVLIDKYSDEVTPQELLDQLITHQTALEEVSLELSQILFENMQLEYKKEDRKRLVHNLQKQITNSKEELKKTKFEISQYNSTLQRIRQWTVDIRDKQQAMQALLANKETNMRSNFNDLLFDEVSEFEETRAIKEIFKNEDKIQKMHENNVYEMRTMERLKQEQENDKSLDHVRKKRSKMEEKLKELKSRFHNLRNVSKVKDIRELVTTSSMMLHQKEDMQNFSKQLALKIEKEQQEIESLTKELDQLKFETETKEEHKQFKLDQIESQHNEAEDGLKNKQAEVERLEKLIDGCCVSVSRVQFQLNSRSEQSRKMESADIKNIHVQLSHCGLILEKMLTMLYQKSHSSHLQIESINTDNQYNQPPAFLGLNQKVYANVDRSKYNQFDDLQSIARSDETQQNQEELNKLVEQLKAENHQRYLQSLQKSSRNL